MGPRAVFFDLDSTLLDNRGFGDVLRAVCQELSDSYPQIDAEALVAANGQTFPGLWEEAEEAWSLGVLDGVALSREAWQRALRAIGCKDRRILDLIVEIHGRRARQSDRLFDDAQPFVDGLMRSGIPLALITNGASDTQRNKIERLGIQSWFTSVVISGEVGVAKPDSLVFELALAETVVEPGDVWHIGDNLQTDVAGANAAGLRSIWLNRTQQPRSASQPAPNAEVASLSELSSG